jgi:hypothetical protein
MNTPFSLISIDYAAFMILMKYRVFTLSIRSTTFYWFFKVYIGVVGDIPTVIWNINEGISNAGISYPPNLMNCCKCFLLNSRESIFLIIDEKLNIEGCLITPVRWKRLSHKIEENWTNLFTESLKITKCYVNTYNIL